MVHLHQVQFFIVSPALQVHVPRIGSVTPQRLGHRRHPRDLQRGQQRCHIKAGRTDADRGRRSPEIESATRGDGAGRPSEVSRLDCPQIIPAMPITSSPPSTIATSRTGGLRAPNRPAVAALPGTAGPHGPERAMTTNVPMVLTPSLNRWPSVTFDGVSVRRRTVLLS